LANLAEGSRRGDPEAALVMKKRTDLPDRLELGDVRLQKDAVDRAVGQRMWSRSRVA
jgi:hypothetical protein